jgi:hypothetical protein
MKDLFEVRIVGLSSICSTKFEKVPVMPISPILWSDSQNGNFFRLLLPSGWGQPVPTSSFLVTGRTLVVDTVISICLTSLSLSWNVLGSILGNNLSAKGSRNSINGTIRNTIKGNSRNKSDEVRISWKTMENTRGLEITKHRVCLNMLTYDWNLTDSQVPPKFMGILSEGPNTAELQMHQNNLNYNRISYQSKTVRMLQKMIWSRDHVLTCSYMRPQL